MICPECGARGHDLCNTVHLLHAEVAKLTAERDKYQGLVHAEMIADMHYCERHELGFMQGEWATPRCPHCWGEESEAKLKEILEALQVWADSEPPCHCGEMAPGPCCQACRAERALRSFLPDPLV